MPMRKAKIKKFEKQPLLVMILTLLQHRWKFKLVQPLWEIIWHFLINLKLHKPYDSTSSLLIINIEKLQYICTRRPMQRIFTAALFRDSKNLETVQISISCRIPFKLWYIHSIHLYIAVRQMNHTQTKNMDESQDIPLIF